MRQPLLLISLSLAVLLSASVLAQDQVQIQFQTDPVLVQTGTEVVFTVLTVSQVLSMTWEYKGITLGLWAGGAPVVNPVPQFEGRITISATQLRIGGAQLRDAGNYTVVVIPSATTGLESNSKSIQLRVFDAVKGVSLFVPTIAVEGKNVSLRCTWTSGTEITVQWGKGGAAITADSRITITDGSLVINPARRGDAGEYTCTVSNPVSAQTATQSLTVYYGPDTPVLTKDTPKECVGEGDVLVGQTVRLTCTSDSLPPALFSWTRDGQAVASGQPDSGVLSLQTFSTDESGRYVCTARNSVTGGTSEQGTVLAIVDTCLNVGEVVGIVIGCLLLLIIIILLILLLVFLLRRRRQQQRQNDTVPLQKTEPNPRPIPPDPQPNGARDLGQGPHPPLYETHIRRHDHLYTAPPENRGNPQTLPPYGLRNSDTHQHNGRVRANGLPHNTIPNTGSSPHNGVDNRAFTHTEAQNANTLPNSQQQNGNIVIQTGASQGGAQQPAVQVSLNTLPQTAQQNNNAQMPTIHVNLNSYPTNGQQTQQDSSFPPTNAAHNNNASQTQPDLIQVGRSNPRMQSGQSYRSDPRVNDNMEAANQGQPGLIQTGYTHHNSNINSLRNANTQTYQQEPEPRGRSDRISDRRDTTASSSRRQMPWDRLRGTPSYPSETLQRGQTSPDYTYDTTEYTTHPPIRGDRTANRSQPPPQSRTTSRRRTPPRRDPPSEDSLRETPSYPSRTHERRQRSPGYTVDRTNYTTRPALREERTANRSQPQPQSQTTPRRRTPPRRDPPSSESHSRSRSADFLVPNSRSVTQLEAVHHTHRSPRTQRESAQRDIRASPGSQTAPRQEATHSNNPQAMPLMSQQASVGRSAVSQGPMTQQGLTADTRALADPNHLQQAHMAQQHRAAPIQEPPQGLGTQTQPVMQGANQPRQGGTAPVTHTSAQRNPSNLTQAALRAHTERAQTFQNRKQQTQAALLHPGPQAQAPAAVAQHPPTPPPVIPLTEFQTLPKKRTQHKSPARGPQPPRPPVNIPVAQRPQQVQQRPTAHHRPATMPTSRHHHHGHVHVSPHRHAHAHTHGHGHPAHATHPRQQQTHRGRPR